MPEKMTAESKIAAARDAVDKAAALLLEHAEGLAMLAMMVDWRERNPGLAVEATADPLEAGPVLRNRLADEAYWQTVRAAAVFAGAKEAHTEAVEMWRDPLFRTVLRSAVERVVGPGPLAAPSPSLAHTVKALGDWHPEVNPDQVHTQTWRDQLMSTASAYVHSVCAPAVRPSI